MSLKLPQLIDARKRSGFDYQLDMDLSALEQKIDQLSEPFIDFVPIRLVTILEVKVRTVIREAVDYGEPYTQCGIDMMARASSKNIAGALHAVQQKLLTVGDIVGHSFATGRMDEIMSSLKAIFGDGIRAELAASRERWTEDESEGIEAPPFMPDLDDTIRYLDRLLQVRHIVVHESPQRSPYSNEELRKFLWHAKQFVFALNWVLVIRLHGTVPRTQAKMNNIAWTNVAEIQAELDALRGGKVEDFKSPGTPEAEIEFHWDRFSDLSAALKAGYLSDEQHGTIDPCIYSGEFLHLTQWRIDNIRRQQDQEKGDF